MEIVTGTLIITGLTIHNNYKKVYIKNYQKQKQNKKKTLFRRLVRKPKYPEESPKSQGERASWLGLNP